MSYPHEEAAARIMEWFHRAEDDLLGATVVTFGSEAGTVRGIKLDEHHGLCFTFDEPTLTGLGRRYCPVSTIRQKT